MPEGNFFNDQAEVLSSEDYDCGEGAGGEEEVGGPVKAHCDPAPVFLATEHSLDLVTLFAEGSIMGICTLWFFLDGMDACHRHIWQ